MKKGKKPESLNNLLGERVFSVIADDKQQPLYNQDFDQTFKFKTMFGNNG
jgi:hypothetical protein